ncbi:MAG: hypothetical protein ACPGJS_15425 [Flammeovirgaceae bacterium]
MNIIKRSIYSVTDFLKGNKFPFKVPPLYESPKVPQLQEWLEEPFGLINGNNICVWFYTDEQGNIVEVLEAGHSNGHVCGKVTALFIETLANLENYVLRLFNAGSLWIQMDRIIDADQALLKRLRNDLNFLKSATGLVQIFIKKKAILDDFRNQLEQDRLQHSRAKLGKVHSNMGNPRSRTCLLDYVPYKNTLTNKPISFIIEEDDYRTDTYDELEKLHASSLQNLRMVDIIHRARTYCEWLSRDVIELVQMVEHSKKLTPEEWHFDAIPYSGMRDYYTASTSSGKENDLDFMAIKKLYVQWMKKFQGNEAVRLDCFQRLKTKIEAWQAKHEGEELNYGFTNFKERYQRTSPHFILEDFDWIIQMVEIIILDYEDEKFAIHKVWFEVFQQIANHIYDTKLNRCFNEVFNPKYITNLRDLWVRLYQFVEELVESHTELFPQKLKDGIPEVFQKLHEKKDYLRKSNRLEFHRTVNHSVLLDAMLRGWPSYFLSTEELRNLYDQWLVEVREAIWKKIYTQLKRQRVKLLPFIENNVCFEIEQIDQKVRLIPLFCMNSEHYWSYTHPTIGTQHYVTPWAYRKLHQSSSKALPHHLDHIWSHLEQESFEELNDAFKQAIQCNPILACSRFFAQFWSYFGTIADQNVAVAYEFQEAVSLIQEATHYEHGREKLKLFYEKHPQLLVEVPLFLAYYAEGYQKKQQLLQQYHLLIEQKNDYYDTLNQLINTHEVCRLVHDVGWERYNHLGIYQHENLTNYGHFLQYHLNVIEGKNAEEILQYIIKTAVNTNLIASIINSGLVQNTDTLNVLTLASYFRAPFKQALDKDGEAWRAKFSELNQQIEDVDALIWEELAQNSYFQQAKKLDPEFCEEVLSEQQLKYSYHYQNTFEPYTYLNIAESKMRLSLKLRQWHEKQKNVKIEDVRYLAPSFFELLDGLKAETMGFDSESEKKIESLKDVKLKALIAEPTREDSLVRLDLISIANNLSSEFATESFRRYQRSYLSLPFYTPAYMKYMELRFQADPAYVNMLTELTKRQIPLGFILAELDYRIEKDTAYKGKFVPSKIELVNQKITVYNHEEEVVVMISLGKQDEKLRTHIKQEIETVAFRTTTLNGLGSSLAQRLLNSWVKPTQKGQLLQRLIKDNLMALVYIFAYTPARVSPNLKNEILGHWVDEKLASSFQDLYAYYKPLEAKELLDTIASMDFVQKIEMNPDHILAQVRAQEGYELV